VNSTTNGTADDVGYWTENIMVMFFKPGRYFVTCSCEERVPVLFHWKHCRMFAVTPEATADELSIAGRHLINAFDKEQPEADWVTRDKTEC